MVWMIMKLSLTGLLISHRSIKEYFFTGFGTKLQFYDSQIAEEIMLHFAQQKVPVPVLPVHDSFIIDFRLSVPLEIMMQEIFHKQFWSTHIYR